MYSYAIPNLRQLVTEKLKIESIDAIYVELISLWIERSLLVAKHYRIPLDCDVYSLEGMKDYLNAFLLPHTNIKICGESELLRADTLKKIHELGVELIREIEVPIIDEPEYMIDEIADFHRDDDWKYLPFTDLELLEFKHVLCDRAVFLRYKHHSILCSIVGQYYVLDNAYKIIRRGSIAIKKVGVINEFSGYEDDKEQHTKTYASCHVCTYKYSARRYFCDSDMKILEAESRMVAMPSTHSTSSTFFQQLAIGLVYEYGIGYEHHEDIPSSYSFDGERFEFEGRIHDMDAIIKKLRLDNCEDQMCLDYLKAMEFEVHCTISTRDPTHISDE